MLWPISNFKEKKARKRSCCSTVTSQQTKGWRDTGRSQSSHHQYPKTSSYIISFWTFLCLGTVTFIQEKSKSVDSYSNKSIVWRNTTNGKTRKEAINSVTWKEHFSCFSYFVGCNTFISERAVKSEANTFHPTSP